MAAVEPELLVIRRAFPEAQRLLAGGSVARVGSIEVGWHGTGTHPELGSSHAVVRSFAGYDDLVGEVLRIRRGSRPAIFVYVLGARDVPTPVSVSRRAFMALGLLAEESLECTVEVAG